MDTKKAGAIGKGGNGGASTAVAERAAPKPPAKVQTVRDLIAGDAAKRQFAQALPKFLTPERFVRVALTTLNKTPKLAECTRESLTACLLDCASLGIEPDGRRAHLIPFRDNKTNTTKCTLIIDYKGYIELARRSGELALWRAELVCDADEFEYDKGMVARHKIDFRNQRGEVYAVYSYVRFKDGAEDYEVMTREEVEAIRKRSKAGTTGPWVTDWKEMAKKTVIRRHSKRLPLSAEFREALDKDADTLVDLEAGSYTVREDGRTKTQTLADQLAPELQEPRPAAEPEPHVKGCKCAACMAAAGETAVETAEAQAEPAQAAGDNPPSFEAAALCPKCEKQTQFVVFSDSSAQCKDCEKTFPELPEEAQGEEAAAMEQTEPRACPNCGHAMTRQGCSPGYVGCPECGLFVPIEE